MPFRSVPLSCVSLYPACPFILPLLACNSSVPEVAPSRDPSTEHTEKLTTEFLKTHNIDILMIEREKRGFIRQEVAYGAITRNPDTGKLEHHAR